MFFKALILWRALPPSKQHNLADIRAPSTRYPLISMSLFNRRDFSPEKALLQELAERGLEAYAGLDHLRTFSHFRGSLRPAEDA